MLYTILLLIIQLASVIWRLLWSCVLSLTSLLLNLVAKLFLFKRLHLLFWPVNLVLTFIYHIFILLWKVLSFFVVKYSFHTLGILLVKLFYVNVLVLILALLLFIVLNELFLLIASLVHLISNLYLNSYYYYKYYKIQIK